MNIERSVNLISEKLNINKKDALDIFTGYWEFIEKQLEKKGEVDIPNFGNFKVVFDEKENCYKIDFKSKKELTDNIFGEQNG